MSDIFHVNLEKEELIFSAAHFITFEDADGNSICEQIHGHNYRVRCQVAGPLNDHGYVVDFIALKNKLAEIAGGLDHQMLVATEHPTIKSSVDDKEVLITFEDRRWIFPRQDCALLPISNTTAELLASYICDQLFQSGLLNNGVTEVVVGVDENEGQWGECKRVLN